MTARKGMRPPVGLLVVLGLVVLAGTARPATKPDNPATKPVPRDANWLKRHEGFVALAKKGGVDVLFLGDSITDAWRTYNEKTQRGGLRVWQKHFEPLKAANFGIGGDRTQHVLWRIQNGELDGIQPKVVVLMIGTNNSGSDSAEQIAAGIEAIVQEIRKRSPSTKILLLAIFPRGEKPNPQRDKITQVNALIAKLDDGKTVRFLDIGKRFLRDDGTIPPEIMYDYLHLTEKGYEIWAEAIRANSP